MEQRLAHSSFSLIFVEETSIPLKMIWAWGRQVYLKQLMFNAEMWLCYWQYSGVSLKGSHFWWATEGGKWRGRWGLMGRTEHSLSPARTVPQAGIRFTYISNSHCAPSAYSRPAVLRNTSQERRWGTKAWRLNLFLLLTCRGWCCINWKCLSHSYELLYLTAHWSAYLNRLNIRSSHSYGAISYW